MVVLEVTLDKVLNRKAVSQMFTGEDRFERIKIIFPPKVSGNDITTYSIELHVVNADKTYFAYPVSLTVSKGKYISLIDVGQDLTEKAQTLTLFLKFIRHDSVGVTNSVTIPVESTVDADSEIEPRSVLETHISSLNTRITQQTSIIGGLNDDIALKSSEIAALETEKAGLENIKASLENQIREATGDVTSLTARLEAANNSIAEYTQAISDKQSEIAGLQAEISDIQTFVDGLNTEINNSLGGEG